MSNDSATICAALWLIRSDGLPQAGNGATSSAWANSDWERPVPVFHGVRRTPDGLEAVLVTEELRGYRDLASQRELEVGQRRRLAEAIGEVLAVLHHARLQHTGLYDKHVMIRWDGDKPAVALIDLEKMRRRLTRAAASRQDLEQFKRRQQLFGEDDWQFLLVCYRRRFSGDCART